MLFVNNFKIKVQQTGISFDSDYTLKSLSSVSADNSVIVRLFSWFAGAPAGLPEGGCVGMLGANSQGLHVSHTFHTHNHTLLKCKQSLVFRGLSIILYSMIIALDD